MQAQGNAEAMILLKRAIMLLESQKVAALEAERIADATKISPSGPPQQPPTSPPLTGMSGPPSLRRKSSHHVSPRGGELQELETESSVEEFERVEIYPHPPQPRADYFDTLSVNTLKFEGLFNLSMLLLVFSLTYNIVRNIMEHGYRVKIEPLFCDSFIDDFMTAIKFHGSLVAYSLSYFFLIKLLCKKWISTKTLFVCYGILQVLLIFVPAVFIIYARISPMIGVTLCVSTLIYLLKSHSYIATNHLLNEQQVRKKKLGNNSHSHHQQQQQQQQKNKKEENNAASSSSSSSLSRRNGSAAPAGLTRLVVDNENEPHNPPPPLPIDGETTTTAELEGAPMIRGKATFPSNVTLPNFLYFICLAPVLVYEPVYPHTSRIRVDYILRKVVVMLLLLGFVYLNFCQFMLPVLSRSKDLPWYYAVMKLAIPSFLSWLAGFYIIFGCILNIISELSFFADRRFYLDWWNTTSLESFWRRWNLPVHEWALRHVYVDMINVFKLTRGQALIATFFVSALLHEYLFFVGLNATTKMPWFFLGMIMQVPLVAISKEFSGRRRGNFIMWWSLFSGQPLLELLYFRNWFGEGGGKGGYLFFLRLFF